jgi:hypothetical protein
VGDDNGQVTGAYTARDRITAGAIAVFLAGIALLMADIAADGRLSRRLGGSPASEAERITKEAAA